MGELRTLGCIIIGLQEQEHVVGVAELRANSAVTASSSSNFAKVGGRGVGAEARQAERGEERRRRDRSQHRRGRVVTKRASHSMSEVIRRGVQEEGGR